MKTYFRVSAAIGLLLASSVAQADCLNRYYERKTPKHYGVTFSNGSSIDFPNQNTSEDQTYERAMHLIEISQGKSSELLNDVLFQKTFQKIKRSYDDKDRPALRPEDVAKLIQSGNANGAFCKLGLSGVWGIRRYVLKQLNLSGSEMEAVPEHAVSQQGSSKQLIESGDTHHEKAPLAAPVAAPGN